MNSQVSSVNSNNVTDSVNNREVLESIGIDDNLSPVLFIFWVEGWIDDLQGADKSVTVSFVREGGINDNTIEVAWLG